MQEGKDEARGCSNAKIGDYQEPARTAIKKAVFLHIALRDTLLSFFCFWDFFFSWFLSYLHLVHIYTFILPFSSFSHLIVKQHPCYRCLVHRPTLHLLPWLQQMSKLQLH